MPERLSVVGFDDVLIASLTVPKLTTIRQPLYEMGQQAVHLLIAQIEQKQESSDVSLAGSHIVVPELIIRASTASVPQ